MKFRLIAKLGRRAVCKVSAWECERGIRTRRRRDSGRIIQWQLPEMTMNWPGAPTYAPIDTSGRWAADYWWRIAEPRMPSALHGLRGWNLEPNLIHCGEALDTEVRFRNGRRSRQGLWSEDFGPWLRHAARRFREQIRTGWAASVDARQVRRMGSQAPDEGGALMILRYAILYVPDVGTALDFYNRAFGTRTEFVHESGGLWPTQHGRDKACLLLLSADGVPRQVRGQGRSRCARLRTRVRDGEC